MLTWCISWDVDVWAKWATRVITTDLDQVLLAATGLSSRAISRGLIPADFETWRVRRKAIVPGS